MSTSLFLLSLNLFPQVREIFLIGEILFCLTFEKFPPPPVGRCVSCSFIKVEKLYAILCFVNKNRYIRPLKDEVCC